MKSIAKITRGFASLAAFAALALGTTVARAEDKTLTLCWAAWDPANALSSFPRISPPSPG